MGIYDSYSRYSVLWASPREVTPRTMPVKIAAAPVLVSVIFSRRSLRSISDSVMEKIVGKFIQLQPPSLGGIPTAGAGDGSIYPPLTGRSEERRVGKESRCRSETNDH